MPETLDPFLFAIDAAFDAAQQEADVDDEPATTLREYLSAAEGSAVPAMRALSAFGPRSAVRPRP